MQTNLYILTAISIHLKLGKSLKYKYNQKKMINFLFYIHKELKAIHVYKLVYIRRNREKFSNEIQTGFSIQKKN